MKRRVGCFFAAIFLFFLLTPHQLSAEDSPVDNVQYEKINPDQEFNYKLKRLKEKIIIYTKLTPKAKANYYKKQSMKRLAELTYVVKEKKWSSLETSSQRYETTVGILTEFVVAKNIEDEKDDVKKLLSDHLLVVDKLKDYYQFGTAEWRFIMNDYNSIRIYLDQLSSS
jgi:hypothetical protein